MREKMRAAIENIGRVSNSVQKEKRLSEASNEREIGRYNASR